MVKYERRDLLPGLALKYQQLYGELQPLLTQSPDAPLVKVKLSEFEGMLNNLEQYLAKDERQTPKQIKQILKLITKQPKSPDHYQNLLSLTAKFSVELDHITRKIRWNSQL
jgi:DNA-binding transcriptional regulator GbsR (MarR family)